MVCTRIGTFAAAAALVAAAAAPARAAVTSLTLAPSEPGPVGSRIRRGTVRFSVDPSHRLNRRVADLDLAPRGPDGRVEFGADLWILAPEDLSRANGTLLYDVNNRGNLTASGLFGAEFLARRGYVVVSSGWIAELLPGGNRLILEAPQARRDGKLLRGRVRAEIVPARETTRLSIAQWDNHGSYPPVAERLGTAVLTVREREKDLRRPIPRDRWRLETTPVDVAGRRSLLPRVDLVLAEGFRPGHIYELIYEAEGSVVQGLGFAGIRDLVSFLKHDRSTANPLRLPDGRPAVQRAVGFGISQSGRALRAFLYDGFNADEEGRTVFEGMLPHVAGAGRGFFNHRFASPTRHSTQHDNHSYPVDLFPFTYGDERDPFSGRRDGLLRRARADGTVPRIFHTQTSAEYWHRAASLSHTTPDGTRDSRIPEEVRFYSIAGQHGPGSGAPGAAPSGSLAPNHLDFRPVMRALLTALDAWIRDGVLPPPSRYPRIAEGDLGGWTEQDSGWRALPGVEYPRVIQAPEHWDYGPLWRTRREITRHPPRSRGTYRVLTPRLDPLNNERGMLRVPTAAAPTGTFTGWNLRTEPMGAPGELLSLAGGFIPFAASDGSRREGDPRPSLAALYGDFAAWERRVAGEAERLVRERFLLPEDLLLVREQAARHRGLFAGGRSVGGTAREPGE